MKFKNNVGKGIAEAIATFALVFCGTGAIAAQEATGAVTHVGVSLVFGFVVLAMIYAVGPISGAHMNPAVTVAFAAMGRMSWKDVPLYLIAQGVGAVLGSATVSLIFPSSLLLGATVPSGPWSQSFVLEMILTFLLMFVVMGVAHDERAEGLMAGVAIGATVALEALLGGPISGASMNPIRSLAPALVGTATSVNGLYVVAPMVGALAGAFTYQFVRKLSSV